MTQFEAKSKIRSILSPLGWRQDSYGHWKLGAYRFRLGKGSVRFERRLDNGSWTGIRWWYYGQVDLAYVQTAGKRVADQVVKTQPQDVAKAVESDMNTPVGPVVVTENQEKDGVEIRFAEKPAPDVIEKVKAQGFRWSKFQKLWYAKRTPGRIAFANSLVTHHEAAPPQVPVTAEAPIATDETAEMIGLAGVGSPQRVVELV